MYSYLQHIVSLITGILEGENICALCFRPDSRLVHCVPDKTPWSHLPTLDLT